MMDEDDIIWRSGWMYVDESRRKEEPMFQKDGNYEFIMIDWIGNSENWPC